MPAARGLFRGAICASGILPRPDGPEVARAAARLFTARTGTAATAAAPRGLGHDELFDLQTRLLEPGADRDGLPPMQALAPFADGELIPEPVFTALPEGDTGADVSLLLGCTAHEFNVLPDLPETPPPPELLGFLGLVPARAETFRAAYENLRPDTYFGQALTDATFRFPAVSVADARAARERPTWLYEFTWTSPVNGAAFHCLDVPFAFDLLDAKGVTEAAGTAPPQALADAVHRAWVAFVRDQDPGTEWPLYSADERAVMVWSA